MDEVLALGLFNDHGRVPLSGEVFDHNRENSSGVVLWVIMA